MSFAAAMSEALGPGCCGGGFGTVPAEGAEAAAASRAHSLIFPRRLEWAVSAAFFLISVNVFFLACTAASAQTTDGSITIQTSDITKALVAGTHLVHECSGLRVGFDALARP